MKYEYFLLFSTGEIWIFIAPYLQVTSEQLLFISSGEIRVYILWNQSFYCCFSLGEIRTFIGGVGNVSTGRCGHRQTQLAGNQKVRVQGRCQLSIVSSVSFF